MASKIEVPHHTYEQIRGHANRFIAKYNEPGVIPVPIEEIVEFSLGLNIIPIPGLMSALEVDAFISSDFKSISVDQYVMDKVETRYRFSLAHEVGHLWLHKELFAQFDFNSVEGWKKSQMEMGEEAYGWLEYQAHSFAGLILAPREALASRRTIFEERIAQAGLDPKSEAGQEQIYRVLAREFNVSPGVIDKRLQKDE